MKISSGYTRAMVTLTERFKGRQDTKNSLHEGLWLALDGLMEQVSSLEVIRQTRSAMTAPEHARAVAAAADQLRRFAGGISQKLAVVSGAAEASFSEALREHSGLKPGPFGPEIRVRLHAMKPGDRVKAVQTLIESKDAVSLEAILDAPPVLTGLSVVELGKYREQFYEATCPDLVKSHNAYRDLAEHVEAAIQTAQTAAQEYGDPLRLRELEEWEAASAKAQEVLTNG